jgi:hypothetical protein
MGYRFLMLYSVPKSVGGSFKEEATALKELVCDLCRGLEGPVVALGGPAELLEAAAAVVLACVTQ